MGESRATFEIVNELGLHARAAAKLVQLASRFRAEVWLKKGAHEVNAKSIMGVLLLCGAKGAKIEVLARGEDADATVRAIGELISAGFGE